MKNRNDVRGQEASEVESDGTRLLQHVSGVLIGLAADVMQVSNRKARIALGATVKVGTGAGFAAVLTGAVGSLGSASTGTAIATLAGAAKSSATLYWIGGLVGGGAAAGGAVLLVGGAGAGYFAARRMRAAIFGQGRDDDCVSPAETRLLASIATLNAAIVTAGAAERQPGRGELRLFSRHGLGPLAAAFETGIEDGTFADLKPYYRVRLRGRLYVLRNLQARMEARK